jgi:hypothetical protein
MMSAALNCKPKPDRNRPKPAAPRLGVQGGGFVEQPLSYEEARLGVLKFERIHKTPSAEVFSGKSEAYLSFSSDVLFEWKSYYDFMCEVNRRLAARLTEHDFAEHRTT